jgi:hypothetical protein
MPVTLPLPAFTVTVASELLQTPPPGVFVSVISAPIHTEFGPEIDPGVALTVINEIAELLPHPLDIVYDMATGDGEIPVTTPEVFTVALVILDDDHTPPVLLDRLIVLPVHTVLGPVIGAGVAGIGLTVISNVAATTPQTFVTV